MIIYQMERNVPGFKKFIDDYIKEVIVYKDHVEVIFNVVFSFVDNKMIVQPFVDI